MQEFRKKQTIVIVEMDKKYKDGKVIRGWTVQNKDKPDDRWFIDEKTFSETYEEAVNDYQPTTFLDRLQVECKELVDKKKKLQVFLGSPIFPKLPREKKTLLYKQERLMSEYIEVLGYRIELEGSKYVVEESAAKAKTKILVDGAEEIFTGKK